MATPFEYSRIHPTVLCISRSSDNTNHPKYSLSPLSLLHPHSPPLHPLCVLSRPCCLPGLPTLLALVLKLSRRTRRPRASFVRQPHQIFSYRCPAFYACLLFLRFFLSFLSRFFDSLPGLFQRFPPTTFVDDIGRPKSTRNPDGWVPLMEPRANYSSRVASIPRLRRFSRDSSNF